MNRRRLPLIVEQSLASVRHTRSQLAESFERELRMAANEAKTSITCREGCSNCCYHPVHITALEGALLYRYLADNGRWTPSVQERIRAHAERTRDLPYEVWFLSVIPCPLLDEKTKKCTAYKGRPFFCRATFALGDPDLCHPHKIEETEMVPRDRMVAAFHNEQAKVMRKHQLTTIIMPLSVAVLMGEKIVNGTIDLEQADVEVLREYAEVR